MTVTLRPATSDDVPEIAAIYSDTVLNGVASYEIEPPGVVEMARRMEAILGQAYPYLVAVDEADAILGYAYASSFRTRPAYRFLVEDSIYLAPQARGRGIGRLLLGAIIDACTERGFRQMVAVIGGASPASIALHRACGFTQSGTITGSGFKHGRWLDTVFMQRPLGEGHGTLPVEPG